MPHSPYPTALVPPESCTFCQLVAADDKLVYRADRVAAFLDSKPLFPGHLLVVPTAHVLTLDQLDPAPLAALMAVVQRATAAMRTALGAEGAFVANNNVVSQSVPHLHIHVVPRTKGDGLRGFFWPRTSYTDPGHEEQVRQALADALR
jgi:histidine triad (HIT) family protein